MTASQLLSTTDERGIEIWRIDGPARLDGTLRPPGDKSIAHRGVLFAALARGVSVLRGLPDGEDVGRSLAAIAALGVRLERRSGAWVVTGAGLHGLRPARDAIDCGNSGTTMRLLCGMLAGQPFSTRLVGDRSLSRRPMRRVAEPLAAMGGRIDCLGADGRPPLVVGGGRTPRLSGCTHRLAVDSAQVRGAILLAGLYAAGPTRIVPRGAGRDHTERLLRACGVRVETGDAGLVLYPTRAEGWSGFDFQVPGDVSSAAFWIALAAATPGAGIRVVAVGLNPGRGRYLEILRAAGARIDIVPRGESLGEPWGDVRVTGARLRSFRIDGADSVRCIDEIPALCAAAVLAGCGARVRDAAELRTKESDRIAGITQLLRAFGAHVEATADGLEIAAPARLRPARIDSRGDHRLAMAGAILALGAPGTSFIVDTACVRTSYPGFTADLARLARPAAA